MITIARHSVAILTLGLALILATMLLAR